MLAIADGMGGAAAGGYAAETAMSFLKKNLNGEGLEPEAMAEVLKKAGVQVFALAAKDHKLYGMGTTLTVVCIDQDAAKWAHVGDSRLYLLRRGRLTQISRDHRFLQDLIDAGDITAAEALNHPLRNYLDQCVGSPDVQPDCGSFTLENGDILILTTDGVHDHISRPRFVSLLDSGESLSEIADHLTKEALSAGSLDDRSIVLGRFRCPQSLDFNSIT